MKINNLSTTRSLTKYARDLKLEIPMSVLDICCRHSHPVGLVDAPGDLLRHLGDLRGQRRGLRQLDPVVRGRGVSGEG